MNSALLGSFNPYWIRSFFRPYLVQFVTVTLLTGLAIFLATKPQAGPRGAVIQNRYLSKASLLLSPNRQFHSRILSATRAQNDLEIWLSDEDLFQQMLLREHYIDKLEREISKKLPELVRYARGVMVRPIYRSSGGFHDYDGDQLERQESDYAEVETNEGPANQWRLRRKAYRVTIDAMGPSPEEAQQLTFLATRLVQRTLEDVATRRVKAQRKTAESYLRAGQRKVALAERSLAKQGEADPARLQVKDAIRRSLKNRALELRRELDDVVRQIDMEQASLADGSFVGGSNPMATKLGQLNSEVVQAQQTLLPTSFAYQELQEKLAKTRQLAHQVDSETLQRKLGALEATRSTKSALYLQTLSELKQLDKGLPSLKSQRNFQERLHDLDAWEQEVLTWEQKLLQIRVEECLCQGEGTSVLLLSPRTGEAPQESGNPGFASYQKGLRLLPVAPLIGLLVILLLRAVNDLKKIGSRAEYYLDAPLLAEISSPPKTHLASWRKAVTSEGSPRT